MFHRVVFFFCLMVLAACADRTPAPIVTPAVDHETLVPIFVATNREVNAQGYFGKDRSRDTSYLKSVVGIPPTHQIGDAPKYSKNPNPKKNFVLTSQREFSSDQQFLNELRAELQKRPPNEREITLFVHGYFNAYSDSVFRGAQINNDFENPGVGVVYSWPSAGHPAGYTYDRESVLFARDSLEQVLYLLSQAGARNVLVMGHSMGGLLVMETLRQIEIKNAGWSNRNIESVLLVSPDIATDLFHEQLDRIHRLPNQVVVFTSSRDRALRLSSTLNAGTNRLGLGDSAQEFADFPIIFVDVSDFDGDSANSHFVLAESPALIAMFNGAGSHEEFAQGKSRSVLDRLSESSLQIDETVTYRLAPDDELREQR